ncbi:helix-turn-helix domain-containing protein [Streptomyces sp. NPDC005794]|uniref:helix-turn-helix domain-containing protein n=1 Tax=Streptomyces sp. NPDC005794 TaxID=3364733 RepID=UPI0036CFCAF4
MSDLVEDAQHLPPAAQELLRLRAVAALVAGRDCEDLAAVLGVSLKAVDNWWAKWQAGGRETLLSRTKGARSEFIRCWARPSRPRHGRRCSITGRAMGDWPASCGPVGWSMT